MVSGRFCLGCHRTILHTRTEKIQHSFCRPQSVLAILQSEIDGCELPSLDQEGEIVEPLNGPVCLRVDEAKLLTRYIHRLEQIVDLAREIRLADADYVGLYEALLQLDRGES